MIWRGLWDWLFQSPMEAQIKKLRDRVEQLEIENIDLRKRMFHIKLLSDRTSSKSSMSVSYSEASQ